MCFWFVQVMCRSHYHQNKFGPSQFITGKTHASVLIFFDAVSKRAVISFGHINLTLKLHYHATASSPHHPSSWSVEKYAFRWPCDTWLRSRSMEETKYGEGQWCLKAQQATSPSPSLKQKRKKRTFCAKCPKLTNLFCYLIHCQPVSWLAVQISTNDCIGPYQGFRTRMVNLDHITHLR